MSIREAAVGILKTHVTWEEFEQNLTMALNTTAKLGPKKNAVDIGEGNGFASKVGLITCDWQGEGAEKLPKRAVLKMGSCLAITELNSKLPPEQKMFKDATPEKWAMFEKGMKDVHNIEVDTYEFFEHFEDGHALPTRYYAKAFTDENPLAGQICMEFIEGSRMMNFWEKTTLPQMKQLARALGRIQADSTKYEVVSESLKAKEAFGEFMKNTPKEKFLALFAPLKFIEASLTEPVEGVDNFLGEYYGANLPSTIHKQLNLTPVLVNGDMRTENILIDSETGDLRALLDWQSSHLGVGVEDLLRISFFAQTTEERRATSDVLIEEMYDAFVGHLDDKPAPYTLEQLKEVSDLLFPHCALFFATSLRVLLLAAKAQAKVDEEKQKRYDVVVDKARGVLEDMVTYHYKNKSSKHSVSWTYPSA